MYMNPFLATKHNTAPTYMLVTQPPKPQKSISILPIESPLKPEANSLTDEIASSALKLETPRKISIGGDATGATLFDGATDVKIELLVKNADRATKDANGKDIARTYAVKSDLSNYAKKAEVTEKINYLETVLFATKAAVNNFQNELADTKTAVNDFQSSLNELRELLAGVQAILNTTRERLDTVQEELDETKEIVNSAVGKIGGENVSFAGDDDIDNLFGD